MDEADKLLVVLRHRRAAAELDATMAQLDIAAGKARLKAARAEMGRIDRMMAASAHGAGKQGASSPARDTTGAAANADAPSARGRGRPPGQMGKDMPTDLPHALAQPAPSADAIRRQRLARQAGREPTAAGDAGSTGPTIAIPLRLDGAAGDAAATSRPKRAGGVRAMLADILKQAAHEGPLTRDDIHARMQAATGGKAIRNSIRTTLFNMKVEGLVTGEAGKWALAARD